MKFNITEYQLLLKGIRSLIREKVAEKEMEPRPVGGLSTDLSPIKIAYKEAMLADKIQRYLESGIG